MAVPWANLNAVAVLPCLRIVPKVGINSAIPATLSPLFGPRPACTAESGTEEWYRRPARTGMI